MDQTNLVPDDAAVARAAAARRIVAVISNAPAYADREQAVLRVAQSFASTLRPTHKRQHERTQRRCDSMLG